MLNWIVPQLEHKLHGSTHLDLVHLGIPRAEHRVASRKWQLLNKCHPSTRVRVFYSKCPSTEEWIKKMWYINTMEYYLAMKKNKVMLFTATWMDLEIIILSEVSQRKTNITHIWNLSFKKDTRELIEVDLQILKTNLWLLKGKNWRKDRTETWDEHTHALLYVR